MEPNNGGKVKIVYNTTFFVHAGSEARETNAWQEKLAGILKKISAKSDTLKPLVQFLIVTIAPAKIYMLRKNTNDINTGSYIDLLIIISSKRSRPFTELEPILEMAYLQGQQVCCSLHSEGNVMEGLRNGHIFYSLHCTAENLIYDDRAVSFPITPPEVLQKIKQNALEKFECYFKKSLHFYESAVFLCRQRHSTISGFLLHQAVELAYRGILFSLNGYDKKTHEIRVLKKYAMRNAPEMSAIFPETDPEEKRLLEMLDGAYLKARYEEQYTISETDLALL